MTATTINDLRSALEHDADLASRFRAWRVEAGPDSTEDEAIWVWAGLKADDVDDDDLSRMRDRIRALVFERVGSAVRWVYVRFRGAKEDIDD